MLDFFEEHNPLICIIILSILLLISVFKFSDLKDTVKQNELIIDSLNFEIKKYEIFCDSNIINKDSVLLKLYKEMVNDNKKKQ